MSDASRIPKITPLKNGPLVLEVNSSPGIEGLEKATGVDVAGLMIEFLERHASPGNTRTRGKG